MALGVRGKLFLLSLGLLGVSIAVGGLYLELRLRTLLQDRIERELGRHARSGCALAGSAGIDAGLEEFDRQADLLGAATGARITLVDQAGRVLGDSELTGEQVARLETHANRPEIASASADQPGASRRYSTTLGADMLYVAAACPAAAAVHTVRAARPLSEVDQVTGSLRLFLLLAGVLAFGAAALLSALASHLSARVLRSLVDQAKLLAEGRGKTIAISRVDEIGGLIGSLNKMAETLRQVVESLAAERDRFEAVLQAMTDGVLAIDSAGRISHANRAAVELLRLSLDPIGRTLAEIVRAPALHEMVAGASQPGVTEFDLPGVVVRRIRACLSLQRSGEGKVIVIQDVTELRRLETVRQDFVANVSHELRTPASVILVNAETLRDGAIEDPVRARQFVDALHRSAQRLSALIADLLDISRIDSGQLRLEPLALAIAPVVQSAVENLRAAADAKALSLSVEMPAALAALADGKALVQVLTNLLDNAIKYSPAGGRIEVRAAGVGGTVRIEVRDDGPGIDPHVRERVFERFYRVDRGRSREMGGTGLGLSIVKNLIEAMGGQVGVEPNEPRGSVFWVHLPIA